MGGALKRVWFGSILLLVLPALCWAEAKPVFDGKTLAGWEGDTGKTWRVEDGAIVGGSLDAGVPRNEFLCTTKTYGDFELKVRFKLLGDRKQANAGVQFRTKRIPKHHEVSGYQADIGQHYWGTRPRLCLALADRYTPDYTTGVAETPGEYLPSHTASSLRNRCSPEPLPRLSEPDEGPIFLAEARIGTA